MKFSGFLAALLFAVVFTAAPVIAGERFAAGLLFEEEDLPQIKTNLESEVFADFWKGLLAADREADGAFLDTLRPGPDCQGLGRLEWLLRREAFVYAITAERSRAARAKKALEHLLEYPRWDVFYDGSGNTLNVLQGSEALMSAAYALDWLHPVLEEPLRKRLIENIAEKGCEACFHALGNFRRPQGKTDWRADHFDLDLSRWPYILDKTNIKGVMLGGFGLGALALAGTDGRAPRWLEMAEYSARTFFELYRADGFYPEGSGYWEYSSRYVYPFLWALRRKTGRDLTSCANLRGAAEGWLALQMPCTGRPRGVVNFGDNGRPITSSPSFFIARIFQDGLAQWAGLNFSRGHDIHSAVFFDPSLKPELPTEAQNYKVLGGEWLVARTGFAVEDIVVAMRSGGPFNHEHSDRSSIILKAHGEMLLYDIPHPSYSRHHPTWKLRGTTGHNCVLIDGRGMPYHDGIEGTNQSADSSFILAEGRRPGYFFWTGDATAAYRRADPDVRSVVRTLVASLEVPCLVVIDRVEKTLYGSRLTALWQLDNSDGRGSAGCSGSRFTITRPGARLSAYVAGSSPLIVSARSHNIPGQEDKYPFVEVTSEKRALSQLMITAMVPAPQGAPGPGVEITPGDGAEKRWQVQVRNAGRSFSMLIVDSGRVPGFKVLR